MKKNKSRALIIVFLSAFLGGGVGTMIKLGLHGIPSFSYSFMRFLVALVVIAPFFLKKYKVLKIRSDVVKVSLLSTANVTLFVFGIRYTMANIGQMLYVVCPIMVALISFFYLKDKLTAKKIIGVLLGAFGSFLLISLKTNSTSGFQEMLFGNILIFLATILYSFYLVYTKKLQEKYSPFYITSVFIMVTTVVSFFLSFIDIYNDYGWWSNLTGLSLLSVLYVGVFATSAAYLLNQYAVKYGSPLISSLTLYIQPLFTFIWSYILLGEKITGNFAIAALLIFSATYLVSQNSSSKIHN